MLVNLMNTFEKYRPLSKWFLGTVVDNDDPEKLGALKVRIEPIFGTTLDISNDDLPWISPLNPYGLGGDTDSSGFSVPEVGNQVVVMFPTEDIYCGYYVGYFQNDLTHQALFDTSYPDRYGWRDSTGNEFYVDKSVGDVKFKHHSGTTFHIKDDGTVDVHSVQDYDEQIDNHATRTVDNGEEVTIHEGKEVTIDNGLEATISHDSGKAVSLTLTSLNQCIRLIASSSTSQAVQAILQSLMACIQLICESQTEPGIKITATGGGGQPGIDITAIGTPSIRLIVPAGLHVIGNVTVDGIMNAIEVQGLNVTSGTDPGHTHS